MEFEILNYDSKLGTCLIFIHGFGKSSDDWSKLQLDKHIKHQMLLITFKHETYLESFDLVSHNIVNYAMEHKLSLNFIIVGHSIGGLYAQCISKLYPKLIKGLILIDSSWKNSDFQDYLKLDLTNIHQNWLNHWDQIPNPNETNVKHPIICHINIIADEKSLNKYIKQNFNGNESDYYKNLNNRLIYFKQLTNRCSKSHIITHIDGSHMLHHKYPNLILMSIKNLLQ
jgi:hypothetical protein